MDTSLNNEKMLVIWGNTVFFEVKRLLENEEIPFISQDIPEGQKISALHITMGRGTSIQNHAKNLKYIEYDTRFDAYHQAAKAIVYSLEMQAARKKIVSPLVLLYRKSRTDRAAQVVESARFYDIEGKKTTDLDFVAEVDLFVEVIEKPLTAEE